MAGVVPKLALGRHIVSPSRTAAGAVMHPFVSDVVSDEPAGA